MSSWNLGNITWPYFSNRDRYGSWGNALPADLSYQTIMTYLSAMGATAIYMCYKVPTRFRFIDLSIAVVAYLRTIYVDTEVVILCHAIVAVGSGFYPMSEERNFFRRFSLFTIIIYGLIALANLVYYIQQRDF
ncbi:hypothetical protein BGZ47_008885 [Haplosporangium gracile]|nr:hypothetical protein BGZ47_008885 [Haplosporangium gracile]